MSRGKRRLSTRGISVSILAVIVVGFCAYVLQDNPAAPAGEDATPSFAPINTPTLGVVGIGDSVTQFDSPQNGKLGHSWFDIAASGDPKLAWLSNDTEHGATTSVILGLVPKAISYKPKIAIIMGGTNDVGQGTPAASTVANLQKMVVELQAAGVRPILATIPPRADPSYASSINTLNDAIRQYAASAKLTLLDLHDTLSTPQGIYKAAVSDDGIHPNQHGQLLLAEDAAKQLQAAGL